MVDTSMAPFVVEVVSQPIEPITIVLLNSPVVEVKYVLEIDETEVSGLETLILGFDFPVIEVNEGISEVRAYFEENYIVNIVE